MDKTRWIRLDEIFTSLFMQLDTFSPEHTLRSVLNSSGPTSFAKCIQALLLISTVLTYLQLATPPSSQSQPSSCRDDYHTRRQSCYVLIMRIYLRPAPTDTSRHLSCKLLYQAMRTTLKNLLHDKLQCYRYKMKIFIEVLLLTLFSLKQCIFIRQVLIWF
jgi:hypothetical protein